MAAEMRSLTLAQAAAVHERLAVPLRPATLHPHYVAADAARSPALSPIYLSFEDGGKHWMHCLHLVHVEGTLIKDASSPYGYGGPMSSSDDPEFLAAAWTAYQDWMREQRVAVEYVRFHPLLVNERHYGGHVVNNREVVSVDLRGVNVAADYPPRLRQTLKKAETAGLVYEEQSLKGESETFGAFHRAAIRQMQTDPFYLFGDDYFQLLADSGLAKLGICRHPGNDGWLAAGLFLDGAGVREYHLAATNEAGRKLGAPSFALHHAAQAAQRLGMRQLYLGGGTDASSENALLFFKGSFSRTRLMYRTGWHVFDGAAYDELKQRFAAEWAAHPERPIFYRKV